MSSHTYTYSPLLDITKFAMALQGTAVGHTIDYHGTVPSTMPIAYALASQADTMSGTLVVAEEQTNGLGRLQRHWEAPWAQALLVSLIVKAPQLPANPAHLPMLAGIAMVQTIVRLVPELADEIGLKWPNDVLLGQDLATGRKVGGVLIETAYRQAKMEHAIIGMGINVNQAADALPAVPSSTPPPTSLRLHLGRMVDRTDLLIALGQTWNELWGLGQARNDIYHQWRNMLYTLGQPVTVYQHGSDTTETISGTAVDVTPDGELVVVEDGGQSHILRAGDVTTRLGLSSHSSK